MSNERNPDQDDPFDNPFGESREPRSGGFMPEFVRKAAVAGLGALFLTEEGLRSLAGQLKLPKEMLGYMASQAERTKDEVARILSEELRRFLQSEKLREEWVKLLQGMTLEVKAQVRLVPAEDSPPAEGAKTPRVSNVSVTRLREKPPAPKRKAPSASRADNEEDDE